MHAIEMEWGRQLAQEVYLLYLLYDIGGDNARQIFVYRICNRARYSYTPFVIHNRYWYSTARKYSRPLCMPEEVHAQKGKEHSYLST